MRHNVSLETWTSFTQSRISMSLLFPAARTVCIRASALHLKSRVQRLETSDFKQSCLIRSPKHRKILLPLDFPLLWSESCPVLFLALPGHLCHLRSQRTSSSSTILSSILVWKHRVMTPWQNMLWHYVILADLWHLSCRPSYVFYVWTCATNIVLNQNCSMLNGQMCWRFGLDKSPSLEHWHPGSVSPWVC